MKRWLLTLLIALVCLCPAQAQVPPTTPGSLATPGFTVSSFDGQYIYYNDNDGETHRIAVTPVQVISAPVNPCNGTQTAINTVNNTFYYCSGGTWLSLSGPGSPGTIIGATPSLSGLQIAYTGNSTATTVTSITGGIDGQLVSVVCKDTNTSFQNEQLQVQPDGSQIITGNVITSTGLTISCLSVNSVFTFLYAAASGAWIQISSSSTAGSTSTTPPISMSGSGQFIANNQGILAGTPNFSYDFNQNIASLSSQLNLGNPNVATNFDLFQGPIPSVVPFSVGLSAPPQVQSSGLKIFLPGFIGGGIWSLSPTSPYVQSFASGDMNHSIPRTSSSSGVKTTVICDLSYCQQGSFLVWVDVSSSATCASATGASIQFTLTWTDDVGAKTAIIPLIVNGGTSLSAIMPLGDTTTWGHGVLKFYNGAPSNISISSSYSPCNTGTAFYNWDAEVVQLQ